MVSFNETLDKTSHFDLVCAMDLVRARKTLRLVSFFRGLCELAGYTS